METLQITIQTKELKYAIMDKVHSTARSLQASGKKNYEEAFLMQESEDDENSYELLRAINDAIAEVKVELGEYLEENSTTTDNRIKTAVENGEAIALSFKMPSNFNSSGVEAIGTGIHDYVVNKSLYTLYRRTSMDIADSWNKDAEVPLARAKKALYKRSRPARPTYEA